MGIEFGGDKTTKADAEARAVKRLGNAADQLVDVITTLFIAEELYDKAGLSLNRDTVKKIRIQIKNIANDLIRAITL